MLSSAVSVLKETEVTINTIAELPLRTQYQWTEEPTIPRYAEIYSADMFTSL